MRTTPTNIPRSTLSSSLANDLVDDPLSSTDGPSFGRLVSSDEHLDSWQVSHIEKNLARQLPTSSDLVPRRNSSSSLREKAAPHEFSRQVSVNDQNQTRQFSTGEEVGARRNSSSSARKKTAPHEFSRQISANDQSISRQCSIGEEVGARRNSSSSARKKTALHEFSRQISANDQNFTRQCSIGEEVVPRRDSTRKRTSVGFFAPGATGVIDWSARRALLANGRVYYALLSRSPQHPSKLRSAFFVIRRVVREHLLAKRVIECFRTANELPNEASQIRLRTDVCDTDSSWGDDSDDDVIKPDTDKAVPECIRLLKKTAELLDDARASDALRQTAAKAQQCCEYIMSLQASCQSRMETYRLLDKEVASQHESARRLISALQTDFDHLRQVLLRVREDGDQPKFDDEKLVNGAASPSLPKQTFANCSHCLYALGLLKKTICDTKGSLYEIKMSIKQNGIQDTSSLEEVGHGSASHNDEIRPSSSISAAEHQPSPFAHHPQLAQPSYTEHIQTEEEVFRLSTAYPDELAESLETEQGFSIAQSKDVEPSVASFEAARSESCPSACIHQIPIGLRPNQRSKSPYDADLDGLFQVQRDDSIRMGYASADGSRPQSIPLLSNSRCLHSPVSASTRNVGRETPTGSRGYADANGSRSESIPRVLRTPVCSYGGRETPGGNRRYASAEGAREVNPSVMCNSRCSRSPDNCSRRHVGRETPSDNKECASADKSRELSPRVMCDSRGSRSPDSFPRCNVDSMYSPSPDSPLTRSVDRELSKGGVDSNTHSRRRPVYTSAAAFDLPLFERAFMQVSPCHTSAASFDCPLYGCGMARSDLKRPLPINMSPISNAGSRKSHSPPSSPRDSTSISQFLNSWPSIEASGHTTIDSTCTPNLATPQADMKDSSKHTSDLLSPRESQCFSVDRRMPSNNVVKGRLLSKQRMSLPNEAHGHTNLVSAHTSNLAITPTDTLDSSNFLSNSSSPRDVSSHRFSVNTRRMSKTVGKARNPSKKNTSLPQDAAARAPDVRIATVSSRTTTCDVLPVVNRTNTFEVGACRGQRRRTNPLDIF